MEVQVWSDFACPYCYIGKRFLEQALAGFEHADEVTIVFRAFELDPNADRAVVNTTQQRIEYKYGKSPVAARQMIDGIMQLGARAGLSMNYDTVRYTNMFDAHRLAKYAETKGKGPIVTESLFKAYFTDNKELARHDVLLDIATSAGLDRHEAEMMLAGDYFAADSRADEAEAASAGVHGVPFFAFENGTGLSGAQRPETLLQALRDNWRTARTDTSPSDIGACGPAGCAIPEAN